MMFNLFVVIMFIAFGFFLVVESGALKLPKNKTDIYLVLGILCVVAGLYVAVASFAGIKFF
jgi:hypothetical protein